MRKAGWVKRSLESFLFFQIPGDDLAVEFECTIGV